MPHLTSSDYGYCQNSGASINIIDFRRKKTIFFRLILKGFSFYDLNTQILDFIIEDVGIMLYSLLTEMLSFVEWTQLQQAAVCRKIPRLVIKWMSML